MPASVSKFQAHPFVLCFVRLEQRFCKPHFRFACCLSVELHLIDPREDLFASLVAILWVSLQPRLHPGSRVPSHSSRETQLTVFPTLKKPASLHHFRDASTNQQAPSFQAFKFPILRAPSRKSQKPAPAKCPLSLRGALSFNSTIPF